MKQLYKCEICGQVSSKKSDIDDCEIRHLQSCIEDLNIRAEIAKQHNLKFVQTYNPVSNQYMWTLEEIK